MRTPKPDKADFYDWERFNKWADDHGIGEHPDDWKLMWDCWKYAYSSALN